MEPSTESIGKGWIAAVIALLILLIVGVIFFIRMGAPIRQAPKKAVSIESPRQDCTCRLSGECNCIWV